VREEEVVCSYMSQIKKDHDRAYSQVFTVVVFRLTKKRRKFIFSSVQFSSFPVVLLTDKKVFV
jgi:hypothetical protein